MISKYLFATPPFNQHCETLFVVTPNLIALRECFALGRCSIVSFVVFAQAYSRFSKDLSISNLTLLYCTSEHYLKKVCGVEFLFADLILLVLRLDYSGKLGQLNGWWHPARRFSATRGRFKNNYELLNLRVLKYSYVNKIHIFQCMSKIFCVKFQRYLWNSTQNISPIHWKIWFLYNMEILRALRFKSS